MSFDSKGTSSRSDITSYVSLWLIPYVSSCRRIAPYDSRVWSNKSFSIIHLTNNSAFSFEKHKKQRNENI